MSGALDGMRILEYGSLVSAPYCTKLFADLGADVVKIEPPHGEPGRTLAPLVEGRAGAPMSALFCYLNENKRSISLDLSSSDGAARLRRLAAGADALVHNQRPHVADALGLTYDALRETNPALVVTSITTFGREGPYAGFAGGDLIATHAGGWASICPGSLGDASLPPLKPFGHQADFIAGMTGAVATLGALFGASASGIGEQIDVSAQECVASILEGALSQYLYNGNVASRLGQWQSAWLEPLACRDGAVVISAAHEEQWQRFVGAMGDPEWATWPVFETAEQRSENFDVLRSLVLEWLAGMSIDDVTTRLADARVPATRYQTVPEMLVMEQLRVRRYFAEYVDDEGRSFEQPGAPYSLSETPWSLRTPAPAAGEHNSLLALDDPWPSRAIEGAR